MDQDRRKEYFAIMQNRIIKKLKPRKPSKNTVQPITRTDENKILYSSNFYSISLYSKCDSVVSMTL